MSETLSLPKRVVAVYDPRRVNSPLVKRSERQIRALEDLGVRVESVATGPDRRETQERLLKLLKPGDAVVPLTGDGGVNMAVGALMRQDPSERAGLIPTANGSAKDCYRNHNRLLDPYRKGALVNALQRPQPDKVHPMQIDVTSRSGSAQYFALNNAGFNYTADFSDQLNADTHRKHRFRDWPLVGSTVGATAVDLVSLWHSTDELSTYSFYDELGQRREAADRTLIHARLAGKQLHFPTTSHISDSFVDVITEKASRWAVLSGAVRMAIGKGGGDNVESLSFLNGLMPVNGHTDGETFNVPAEAEVSVSLAESYVKMYGKRTLV